ncbi:MAG: hypothetical protein FWD73_03970 [Polyangiaceae bacterium]|nr:hypothetical protein [Polyangiaceae bacterium]
MLRSWLAFALALTLPLLCVLCVPRQARADQGPHTVTVAVLGFDSEDADEQAIALSGAMRSRVRAAEGWSLLETARSLGMLTAALKCPPRPPADCQQKISEQIRADRYIWGFVSKGPSPGEVIAEIHLYQKDKDDTVIKESYAENLKDANDDTLRKVAAHIVDRLSASVIGTVVVRAGKLNGEIVLDGDKRIPLRAGTARAQLAAGSHSVEIVAPGVPTTKRNVLVSAGKESLVDLPTLHNSTSPFLTRKVIGGATIGAGVILGGVAVEQALLYSSLQNRGRDRAEGVAAGTKPCAPNSDPEFCTIDKRSKQASTIAIAAGALGAVGVGAGLYLLLTGDRSNEKSLPLLTGRTRVLPTVGAGSSGAVVDGIF